MALSMQERIKSARSPLARTADIQATVTAAKAEAAHASQLRDRAAAESIDFVLSEADRDEAAANAQRHDRTVKALGSAIAELEELIVERGNSARRKAAEAARAEAIAERDALAERFKAEVPAALEALCKLFGQVEANTAKLQSLNIREPNAEEVAREVRFLGIATSPESLVKLKIPHWSRGGVRMWPIEAAPPTFDYAKAIEDARKQEVSKREIAQAKAEEHRKRHGQYRVASSLGDGQPARLPLELLERESRLPRVILHDDPWQGELAHDIAEELRSVAYLVVTRMDEVRNAPRA